MQKIHPDRACPSCECGHATHLLAAGNAISSHLIFLSSFPVFDGGGVSFPSFSHCDWCAAFADAVCFKVEDVEMFLTIHAVHRKAICHMDCRGFRIREVCASIGRERLHNILKVSWCDDHQFEMTGELNDLSN